MSRDTYAIDGCAWFGYERRQIEYNDKKENLLKVSCLPYIKVACDREIFNININ